MLSQGKMSSNGTSADRKVALVTGITGQDGSYLAEFLIGKGYTVHGIIRRSSSFNTGRIQHLYSNAQSHAQEKMVLHYGDLVDGACLVRIVASVRPTEIYNLAAMSHVKVSFEMAEYTADVDGVGTLRKDSFFSTSQAFFITNWSFDHIDNYDSRNLSFGEIMT